MKKIMAFALATVMVMGITTMTAFAAPRKNSINRLFKQASQTICTGVYRGICDGTGIGSGGAGGGRGIKLRDGSCLTR